MMMMMITRSYGFLIRFSWYFAANITVF